MPAVSAFGQDKRNGEPMTLTARLQAIRERLEYARECESPYSAPYSVEDIAFLTSALEKAIGALEYYRRADPFIEEVMQGRWKNKAEVALAEIEKLAGEK